MKLGANIGSYRRAVSAGKLTEIDWIKRCREELNLDGIELLDYPNRNPEPDYLKEIKKLCVDLHLEIYAVSCTTNFGQKTVDGMEQEIHHLKHWIDIGYYLGAPIVRFFPGSPAPEIDETEQWRNMIVAIRKCLKYAEKKGVVLAAENHHGYVSTSKDMLKLIKKVKSDWLRICLDTGNYTDIYPSIEETINLAAFVHTKLYSLDADGIEQKLDYDRIFKILKKGNYNGYLSVEYEGEEDEFTAVLRGVKYLKTLIAKSS